MCLRSTCLRLTAQICVVAIDPILAGRSEDIEIVAVFEGLGTVRHIRRNYHRLSFADDDGLTVDLKFKRAFEDVGDLLVLVTVHRTHGALLEEDARHHGALAPNHLASDGGA